MRDSLHNPVPLKIAVAEYPHTAAVRNGSIAIEGVDAEMVTIKPQIAAFRRGVPTARVLVLPNANHYVFKSNEAEVLRDIRGFIDGLSRPAPAGRQ